MQKEQEKLEYYFKPETLSKFDDDQKEILELIINKKGFNYKDLYPIADERFSPLQMFQILLALVEDVKYSFFKNAKYTFEEIRSVRKDLEDIKFWEIIEKISREIDRFNQVFIEKLDNIIYAIQNIRIVHVHNTYVSHNH
ncbi:hypothetical protein ACXYRQ_02740 [Mycoplasma sp. 394]